MPKQPQARSMLEHKINPESMLTALRNGGFYDDASLILLLGEDRHHLTLSDLEKALVRDGSVSEPTLVETKRSISGHKGLPFTGVSALPKIPLKIAESTGIIALEMDRPSVAMVEDSPEAYASVVSHVGEDCDIYVCSLSQFAALVRTCYGREEHRDKKALGDVYEVLDDAVRRGASDIHLSVGYPPSLRVNGRLSQMAAQPLDVAWMRSEVARLGGVETLAKLDRNFNVDMALPYGAARFRLNFGADRRGPTVSARKIPTRIPSSEEIGLPPAARTLVSLDRGLVLVTGPTGSGKSTTLAALLNDIAKHHAKHIITLEDPVEFHIHSGRSVVNQRELGSSFNSFPDGLRQALRQDPDVILLGEMRDMETIKTALTAAETGHLVLGTLHTMDASSTVARIVSAFPADEQTQVRSVLGYVLKATISQTLLPLASGNGRVAAFEIMLSTAAVANNLRKPDSNSQIRQILETSSQQGMQTLDMALVTLVQKRLVSRADALEKVTDAEDFEKRLHM